MREWSPVGAKSIDPFAKRNVEGECMHTPIKLLFAIAIVTVPGSAYGGGQDTASARVPASSAPTSKPPTWVWAKTTTEFPKRPLRARQRHLSFEFRELPLTKGVKQTRAQLSKVLAKGGHRSTVWRRTITDDVWGPLAGAALLVADGRVFVAHYSTLSTGCRLYAFSAKSGTRLWAVELEGIGPIAHSKWRNDVQLAMHEGNPTVFGREGQRYIEERDAATGVLVRNQKLGWKP